MKLIADKRLRGAHLTCEKGDEFEVGAKEAAQLIAAKVAHPAPQKVERAVDAPAVEKAVDEPEVQERVIPPETPEPRARKTKPKKVSGKA